MRTGPMVLLGLLSTGALVVGFYLGQSLGRDLHPAPAVQQPPPKPPPPTPASAGPVSILLIWVESLQAPRPRLLACWVMVFAPEAPTYFLIGFSPESQIPQPDSNEVRTLRDYYDTDTRLALTGAFTWQALGGLAPGLPFPRLFKTLDSPAVSRTIDRLGGVTVHGQRYDGQATLALYESPAEADATARLQAQSEVVTAIWTAAGAQHWSLEMLLTELSQGPLRGPDDETIALVRAAPPLADAQVAYRQAPLTVESVP